MSEGRQSGRRSAPTWVTPAGATQVLTRRVEVEDRLAHAPWSGGVTPAAVPRTPVLPAPGIDDALPLHMTDTLDILEILESQHSEVDELIERLERGKGNRTTLFFQLADKLAAHAAVEEKVFYPAVMAKQTTELLHESVEEHLEIKRLIADMLALDPSDDEDEFNAKLSVLKENVSHHAHEEEERKLFPMLRRLLSSNERAAIGNDVLAMFESLIEHAPRFQVPSETGAAAPLPGV
jgi:hypothetical protein